MQRLNNIFFISLGPKEAQDLFDELEGVSQEQETLTELYFHFLNIRPGPLHSLNYNGLFF